MNPDNIQVKKVSYQKHLGIFLDEKLTFKQDIESTLCKMNKVVIVIEKLKHILQ